MRVPDLSRRFGRYLMPDSDEYEDATLGSSSMAKRLRACVAAAAADAAQRPVCVQGEPGEGRRGVMLPVLSQPSVVSRLDGRAAASARFRWTEVRLLVLRRRPPRCRFP